MFGGAGRSYGEVERELEGVYLRIGKHAVSESAGNQGEAVAKEIALLRQQVITLCGVVNALRCDIANLQKV